MEDMWRNQVKWMGSFKHSQWRARSRPEIYSSLYHYLLSGLCIYLLLQPWCFYHCPDLVQSQPSYKWKQVRLPYSPAQNLPRAPDLTQVKKASVLSKYTRSLWSTSSSLMCFHLLFGYLTPFLPDSHLPSLLPVSCGQPLQRLFLLLRILFSLKAASLSYSIPSFRSLLKCWFFFNTF